jgi:hypothetical protein
MFCQCGNGLCLMLFKMFSPVFGKPFGGSFSGLAGGEARVRRGGSRLPAGRLGQA